MVLCNGPAQLGFHKSPLVAEARSPFRRLSFRRFAQTSWVNYHEQLTSEIQMSFFTPEFIKAIPKTDLHLHLDGSLRVSTLIELASAAGVELPADDEQGLRALVFKDKYNSLEEYLRGFGLTCAPADRSGALPRFLRTHDG